MKFAFLPVLLCAGSAHAHAGDHGFASLMHLLTEPDHLALLALAVAAGVAGARVLRRRR